MQTQRLQVAIKEALNLRAQGAQNVGYSVMGPGSLDDNLGRAARLSALKTELTNYQHEEGIPMRGPEIEMLKQIAGAVDKPTGLGGGGVDGRLRALLSERSQALPSFVASQGHPVVSTGYGIDPKTGQRVPTMQFQGRDYQRPPPPPAGVVKEIK